MKLWSGDFSTGNLSQWSGFEAVDATRLQVLDAPGRPGTKALRATVRHDQLVENGYRAEVVKEPEGLEGQERWYSWSTYFGPEFPVSAPWQVTTQWHNGFINGQTVGISPPVAFALLSDKMQLLTNSVADVEKKWWEAPIVRGQWVDYLFHVCWSGTAAKGFVELTVNGKLVVPRSAVSTMFAPYPNYLKQGLYRSRDILPEASVWHQGMSVYDMSPAAVVAPPVVPAPPAAPLVSPSKIRVQTTDGKWFVGDLKPE